MGTMVHVRGPLVALTVMSTAMASLLAATPSGASEDGGAGARTTSTARDGGRTAFQGPVLDVRAGTNLGAVPNGMLGVNHQFNKNGHGMWDAANDRPKPEAVAAAIESGVKAVRFPGGTVANLYDWKKAVGPHRGCQIDAGRAVLPGYRSLRGGLAYGPDEHMEFVDAIGAKALMLVPFVNETPADAADWVEYMNSPANAPGNPNGGVDWADRRAENGHPAPYGVVRWEIGNELNHTRTRHWLSKFERRAVKQYADGARVRRTEMLGRRCNHRAAGARSDGTARQRFTALYPPLEPRTLDVVIDGEEWTRVRNLSTALPTDKVFTVDRVHGVFRFGNGLHGAIPAEGSHVQATYDSIHRGYFAFAKAMHDVDPSVKVCSSWGNIRFVRTAAGRRFDCLTKHAVTTFKGPRGAWDDKLEGHDRLMLGADEKRNGFYTLRDKVPDRIPIWLTEVVTTQGDDQTWPGWSASVSSAVATAAMWGSWLKLGVPWVMADDLLSYGRGLLGGSPGFHMTARGLTRRALAPMFTGGGHQVSAEVTRNPVRYVEDARRYYTGLVVTGIRRPNGTLWLMVVNRLPTRDLTVRVRLAHFTAARKIVVRRVRSDTFYARNKPGEKPHVTFTKGKRDSGKHAFTMTFPATSTTVLAIPRR